jgi:uncharacterized lipoprotein YmbA
MNRAPDPAAFGGSAQFIARTLRNGAAAALLALLGACASGPPPRLISLNNDTAVPPDSGNERRPLLVVRTVSVPEYLDRRALVYRSTQSELQRFPDSAWAERLDQSVTRWIAVQLAADLPHQEVRAFTAAGGETPAVALNLELLNFEAEALPGAAPVLRLRCTWHLSGAATAEGAVSADVPMNALDVPSTVAAMQTALTQASEAIAERLR